MQDEVGGLEAMHRGKWYKIPPKPDTFVINFGNMLEHISYGVIKGQIIFFKYLQKFFGNSVEKFFANFLEKFFGNSVEKFFENFLEKFFGNSVEKFFENFLEKFFETLFETFFQNLF